MTRIETTKELLYYLGHDGSDARGGERAGAVSAQLVLEVAALGRRIAIAAAIGPVEVVAT